IMAPIIISIIALLISLILPAIGIYNFFIERKIFAEIREERDRDYNGNFVTVSVIVLSTKGSNPVYYNDYQVIRIDENGERIALRDRDIMPYDGCPGVITNEKPKIIKNHGLG